MKKPYYIEKQKFGSLSLNLSMGVIYSIVIGFLSYALTKQFVLNELWSHKEVSDKGLMVASVLFILVLLVAHFLLFTSKLTINIGSKGIFYKFPPYFNTTKEIKRSSIISYKLIRYNAIRDFGGRGVKKSSSKKVRALTVSGNTGLLIKLNNKKEILLGTQRSTAIDKAMRRLMSSK